MCSQRTIAFLLLSALPAAAQLIAKAEPTTRPQVMQSYGKLPLSFEANRGQTDQRVKFLARGPGYSLFLTEDSAVLSLRQQKTNAVLRMRLLGANAHVSVSGTDTLPGKSNYFVGNDPNQWRTNVPNYAAVKYSGVYPGIDLVYHGSQRLLEYDFLVAPGADPRAIDLRFQGARKLSVNSEGHLVIDVGGSEVIEHAPEVYQDIGGQRHTVAGRYVLRGKNRVGFNVAEYDRSQLLVIDPTLVYSTYLGGSGQQDFGFGIAVDTSGTAYITGLTNSSDFPTTPGSFRTNSGGAFVTKLNAAGSAAYSTYLGGWSVQGNGIAVDAVGNAYITGSTQSSDFPTTPGAFQTVFRGYRSAFATELNAAGSALVYSTYLGGGYYDEGYGIAVDGSSNAYVVGATTSTNFPITPGAFQTTLHGGQNAFVTKLNAAGSALVYGTYLGGSPESFAYGIAVDVSSNAYVTGYTDSPNFPTTPGAFQTTLRGQTSAFVTKLNVAGSALLYSTYLGGNDGWAVGIAVDALGNAFVTGHTSSSDFPITPAAFQTTLGGGIDTFVSKLDAAGSALLYSTYLGGSGDDVAVGIAIDALGNAYVTGGTSSSNFPTTPGAFQTTLRGSSDAFVSKLNNAGSALAYSTFLGGSQQDGGGGIAVDLSGNAFVTGITGSSNFPTTPGAFQTTLGGGNDAFVSMLSLGTSLPGPVTTANLSGPLGNNGWYIGPVTVTLSATDPNSLVAVIHYSLDSGPYQIYFSPFSVSSDGVHPFLFYSVNSAGHQETTHEQNIKIDTSKPLSYVAALPPTAASPNFNVQWHGTDAGSFLRDYTIYVSDNGAFTPWLNNTTATKAWFTGFLGHTYGFYCIARDNAGNQEFKTVAEATTQVPAQMPADVNADGKIDCADLAIVKASLGKRTGQTGFDARADVNHDGVVDVRDLALVSQKLVPGTSCP